LKYAAERDFIFLVTETFDFDLHHPKSIAFFDIPNLELTA